MIGSHKFLKRQGPGWLLVPELWNCEGPQRAQTQHLCRNVGLTGSCELRYFPLTRSQHPQKVVPLRGCYFDKLKLQGTVNLCSSILLFQLLQRHIRNTQFCEQLTFDYEKITLWSFCAFLLPGFKLSMLGLMREIRGHTNGINPGNWAGTPPSFSCNRGASKHSIKLKVANAELKGKAFLYNIINLENSLPRENIEAKTY